MPYNPPKGPGKGPGNGKPKAAPFNSETGKEASEKAGFVRQIFRDFRKANPDYDPGDPVMSRKERQYVLERGEADALQRMHNEIMDPKSAKGFEAAKAWHEFTDGKAKQAVELGGQDGGPIIVVTGVPRADD